VYGDKALKRTQLYDIMKKVKEGKPAADQRGFNTKRKIRNSAFVAEIAAEIESDRRVTVRKLARAHGVSTRTIHATLHGDLHLSKKSARWVPKLLSDDKKKERVRTSEEFLKLVRRHSLSMLDNIVTMDESAVSFHTPESKQQSKQWLLKGSPGPIKAKVHATRKKQMVLAFFDSKGLIYTNFVPRGRTVNAAYIIEALARFLKALKEKRPTMTAGTWWFHWDNAPVYTAAVVTNWMAARQFQILDHPPYSPDLAPADFFLFPSVKRELAGKTLTQETLKKAWEGAVRTLSAADFATAFRRWYERCEKCIDIAGGYVEKS
jgi:histone-lysine N-methyltransferase SETMAR